MFSNPLFWVSAAFVLLIAWLYKPVGRIVATSLDGRARRIQDELDEALRLKEEAQALLASYQKQQKEIMQEAEEIVRHAQQEAERIGKTAEADLDAAINKRVEVAMQKIATYEASVLQELRCNAIDVATGAVRVLLQEKLNATVSAQLVAESIQEANKKLN